MSYQTLQSITREYAGQEALMCPVCEGEFNHADIPIPIDGHYLDCRDDTKRGGWFIPMRCEFGHAWGIGTANHKGTQFIMVFKLPIDADSE